MPKYYGKQSGMTTLEYFAFLFDLNCKCKIKLSDEEIALKVLKEFPHRRTILNHIGFVSRYRYAFNRGTLHGKYAAPRIPCFRYIKGVAVTPKTGAPLTNAEIRHSIRRQKELWSKDYVRKLKEETKPPINHRIRIAWKAVKKRRRLQKKMAKLQGLPAWED
jgi:hypothetical protein